MLKFNVGNHVVLGEDKYAIVGIDHYTLINLHQNTKTWHSFTIANDHKRASFSYINNELIFWESMPPPSIEMSANNSKFPLDWDFSGIAQINFQGDQGVSQPWAELIWFKNTADHGVFLLERFLTIENNKIHVELFFYNGTPKKQDFIKLI